MFFGESLERLVQMLSRFPSLGPRSAQRILLHLMKHKETLLRPLIQLLSQLLDSYRPCYICGYFDEKSPCHFCASTHRESHTICVVAEMQDVWALEKAGFFRGRYHLLGGLLSCFEKSAPEDLHIDGLLQRITPDIQEIILALDSNMEGQTTLHFLTQELSNKAPWLKISTLARGIPMGGELSYLDQGTLMSAFHGRKDVPRLPLTPRSISSQS